MVENNNNNTDTDNDNDNDNKTTDTQKTLTNEAIMRIGRDVRDIMREPIEHVHYIHSSREVDKAYVVIVGTEHTPYFCVPMFYSIQYPSDYPYQPPKMKFLSYSSPNGVSIRMHPNYYVNGKCCLSILNSWSGEQWTGCQTIRSVLMTIMMTLNENPLENEPGHKKSKQCDEYRAIVADAGINLISQFLTGDSKIRFCEDDVENEEINMQMKEYFVNSIVKRYYTNNMTNGLLYSLLNETQHDEKSNYLTKWMTPFKIPNMDEHYIPCYRLTCKIDYDKTREKAVSVLNKYL